MNNNNIKLSYRISFGILKWLGEHKRARRLLFWACVTVVVWGLVKFPAILLHLLIN